MATNITAAKHTVCYPSKMLAAEGGAHLFSIILTEDTDNGRIIKRGAYDGIDRYKEGTGNATSTFVILEQANNGNWYVEVVTAGDGLLVRQDPVVPERSFGRRFNNENLFYNAAGDVVECYSLVSGDVFEISADGFTGDPVAGKTCTVVSKKLKVAVD